MYVYVWMRNLSNGQEYKFTIVLAQGEMHNLKITSHNYVAHGPSTNIRENA